VSEELRDRIARALWDNRYPGYWREGLLWDLAKSDADAVIAALGLREVSGPQYVCDRSYGGCPARQVTGRCEHVEYIRRYLTPWERIEEDG
jgi:hypothetical protein